MINEDFVTTLKTKWMTTEINVLREYLQHNFLNNSEKIDALLTRSKSRDFFDLYYILRARLGTKVVIERRDAILELIEKTKGSFVDLKQFLPKNFWPINLKKKLKGEVKAKKFIKEVFCQYTNSKDIHVMPDQIKMEITNLFLEMKNLDCQ